MAFSRALSINKELTANVIHTICIENSAPEHYINIISIEPISIDDATISNNGYVQVEARAEGMTNFEKIEPEGEGNFKMKSARTINIHSIIAELRLTPNLMHSNDTYRVGWTKINN